MIVQEPKKSPAAQEGRLKALVPLAPLCLSDDAPSRVNWRLRGCFPRDAPAGLEEGDVVSMLVKGGHAGAMTWQGVENMRTKRTELEKVGGEDLVWDAGCASVETITRSEERQWVE
jgi:hypothetical protein